MSQVLSQDEVDALLKGISGSEIETETDKSPETPGGKVYDLTSQDKVVRGRIPILELVNDRFARLMRASLSSSLRKPVGVTVSSNDMMKYGDFLKTLPVPTSLHIFRMKPLRGNIILVLESKLVFCMVDIFFGGSGAETYKVEGREFTGIENRLVKKIIDMMASDLKEAWKNVQPVSLHFVRSEVNPQFATIVSSDDIVVIISFELEMENSTGKITLCIPYSALEPIKNKLQDAIQSEQLEADNMGQELKELKKIVKQSTSSYEGGRCDFICTELKELKWITQFLFRQAAPLSYYNFPEHLVHFYCQMLKQGICEEIVLKLIRELKQDLSPDALGDRDRVRDSLVSKIEKELLLAGPIDLVPGKTKIAALVGPTGAGKTTTLAKLAALYALDRKRKVALVTIDTYRIAAVEQLRVYAKIMGLSFKTVSSPEEFKQVLVQFADRDLILVDTAGRSQRDQFRIKELKSFLRQSFPVEIYLTMSITHKEDNLSAIGNQFGFLPIDRIIFTKLDESYTYGSIVNQIFKIKKPLSYLTTGQKIPEDIEVAEKERIISLILGGTDIHYC